MKELVVIGVFIVLIGTFFTPSQSQTRSEFIPCIERTAIIDRVIDGDTVQLTSGEKVRLVGINTPEIGEHEEAGGLEALEFVESICPAGLEVGLNVDDLSPRDHYGRTLAVVYLKTENGWTNLNAELLKKGFAEVLFIPPSEFNPYSWLD